MTRYVLSGPGLRNARKIRFQILHGLNAAFYEFYMPTDQNSGRKIAIFCTKCSNFRPVNRDFCIFTASNSSDTGEKTL